MKGSKQTEGAARGDATMTAGHLDVEAFAKHQAALLGRVPDAAKSRFRCGGFCRWGGAWLPVLELGPFDVGPGPVRDLWLDLFERSEKSGRDMARLVYWYGTSYEERGRAYSFVKASQLVDYEAGVKRGLHVLPKKLQDKIANGGKLTKKEQMLKRGLVEIEADMKLDKSERASWMMDFREEYEMVEVGDQQSEFGSSEKKARRKKCTSSTKQVRVKESKGKSAKRKSTPQASSVALTDAVVSSTSSNVGIGTSSSTPKRARRKDPMPSPVASSACDADRKPVKPDTALSSAGTKRPTPEECRAVVRELGRLHPEVIEMNDRRRELFAFQRQQANGPKRDPSKTPVTDAIINTMLSQNTTAANQDRAFASLKKAYPGGWDDVANETDASRIEDAIRVAGLAQTRAERMQAMLRTVQKERGQASFEYLSNLESNDDIVKELSRHKGMGPKTISCVLLFALGRADFPVDTHVLRISKQMGWVPQSFSREAAYGFMNDVVPDEYKLDLHCLLVTHGKQCNKCAARGRAQFPPEIQWICPMAAIKRGELTDASDDSLPKSSSDWKRANVKEESHLYCFPLGQTE